MIDALDHVFDDLFWCVPDAEVPAKLGIERFKERFVEVGNGLIFAEGIEEGGLDAVEGFSSKIEDFLELDGVERAGVGHFAEELAKDRNAEVVSGKSPIKVRARSAAFGCATPEHPGGEDAVKEGLDKGGAEEVLASFAFESHAERFLQGLLDGVEAGERMVFGACAGFSRVGREEPAYFLGLD